MFPVFPYMKRILFGDTDGRFDFFFYMGAYISQETNETYYMACVCERSEWGLLEKTR